MKTAILAIAIAALAMGATPASAAPAWSASGSYKVGSPTSQLVDACDTNGATNGIESNCVNVPLAALGLPYTKFAQDDNGQAVALTVCFYRSSGPTVCNPPAIPLNAVRMSVSSSFAIQVSWTVATTV